MTPSLTPEAWAQIRYEYEHGDRPIHEICADYGISDTTLRDRMRRWHWTRRRPPIPREGPPAMMPPVELPMPSAWPLASADLRGDEREETQRHPTPPAFAEASAGDPPHRCAGGGMEQAATLEPSGNDGESCATVTPTPSPSPQGGGEDTDPASIVPRLQGAVARVLPAIEATLAKLAGGPLRPREMEQTARALGALTRTLRELNAVLKEHPAHKHDDDPVPVDIDAFRFELARRINAFVAAERAKEEDEDDAASPPASLTLNPGDR